MDYYTDESPRLARAPEAAPPSAAPKPTPAKRMSWRERLLLQSIVSGVLLAVILFVNVLDVKPAAATIAWLENAITQDTAGAVFASAWTAAQNLFAPRDADTPILIYGQDLPQTPDITPEQSPAQSHQEQSPPSYQKQEYDRNQAQNDPQNQGQDRIDEDILDALRNTPDLYDQKNR